MNTFPGRLDEAVAAALAGHSKGLAGKATALSDAYRRGANSRTVDVTAYLAARLPATYAACSRVFREVQAAAPAFAPTSLLDVGAGPGTASWAALATWPTLNSLTQVEADPAFAGLASLLNAASGLNALEHASLLHQPLQADGPAADVVVASYVLAELPLEKIAEVVGGLWPKALQALVLIEPGTPQGFARIRAARETLLKEGAVIAAPCTHGNACPMIGSDWCHFKVRLQRSRAHMHAKGATVPFEDEAFSYLVAMRGGVATGGHRVLAPPAVSKVATSLKLCGSEGLSSHVVPARDKQAYKQARKCTWGDRI